jgi:hypothetical protein
MAYVLAGVLKRREEISRRKGIQNVRDTGADADRASKISISDQAAYARLTDNLFSQSLNGCRKSRRSHLAKSTCFLPAQLCHDRRAHSSAFRPTQFFHPGIPVLSRDV